MLEYKYRGLSTLKYLVRKHLKHTNIGDTAWLTHLRSTEILSYNYYASHTHIKIFDHAAERKALYGIYQNVLHIVPVEDLEKYRKRNTGIGVD